MAIDKLVQSLETSDSRGRGGAESMKRLEMERKAIKAREGD